MSPYRRATEFALRRPKTTMLTIFLLAAGLGSRLPGIVVDAMAAQYRLDSPDYAIVSDFPAQLLPQMQAGVGMLHQAQALTVTEGSGWQVLARLHSSRALILASFCAYALLAAAVYVLINALALSGFWILVTAVMLIGYFFLPRAIWQLCVGTHAGEATITDSGAM